MMGILKETLSLKQGDWGTASPRTPLSHLTPACKVL